MQKRSGRIGIVDISYDHLQNSKVTHSQRMIRNMRINHARQVCRVLRRYLPASAQCNRLGHAVVISNVHPGPVVIGQDIVAQLLRDRPLVGIGKRADMLQSASLTLTLMADLDQRQPMECFKLSVHAGPAGPGFVGVSRLQRNLDSGPAIQPVPLGALGTINLANNEGRQFGGHPTEVRVLATVWP